MSLKPVLARLANGETLAETEAEAAFDIIMAGEATPSQIAGLLMAMRVRGETVAEMTGAVRAMIARMNAVEAPAGAAVSEVLAPFALPPRLTHLVLVNGTYIPPEGRATCRLSDGDVLAVWPPIAGG